MKKIKKKTDNDCSKKNFIKVSSLISAPLLKPQSNTIASIKWTLDKGLVMDIKSTEDIKLYSESSNDFVNLGKKIVLSRLINSDTFSSVLMLPFEAISVFGTDVRPGVSGVLLNGTISVYEDVLVGRERYLAGQNQLILGDTVKFIKNIDGTEKDISVKGFIRVAPNGDGNEQGMFIVAYSGLNELNFRSLKTKIYRFGSNGYVFSPGLWTRIQNAPDMILLLAIIGILVAIIELISIFNEKVFSGIKSADEKKTD